jgi:hypothetical protein
VDGDSRPASLYKIKNNSSVDKKISRIYVSHGGGHEEYYLMGCDAV